MKSSCFSPVQILFLTGFSLTTPAAFSQVMLSPVAVVGSDLGTFNDSLSVTNMINRSGVETPFVSGTTVFDTYFTSPHLMWANSGDQGTNNWQGNFASTPLAAPGYLDFDLGAVYQVNKLAIWNRSLKDITVKVLSTLGGAEQVATNVTLVSRLSYDLSYPVDVIAFPAPLVGRYVRLAVNDIHPFQGFTFGYPVIGELVVSAAPVGSSPPPTLSITLALNGDAQIHFTGTLTTSPTANGTFTNVPGNPTSPHTVPKASLGPRQFFRAKGN